MKIKHIVTTSAAVAVLVGNGLYASGWRIPEQSARSVALSGAYVANANGADAVYYNPANMSFNPNAYEAEIDLTYIHLAPIDYEDNTDAANDASSKSEDFLLPTLFLTTKDYNGWRFGISSTVPGGLSKRWDAQHQKKYAKEFTLEIVEINPNVSYKVLPNLSVAAGVRLIYSRGIVKSEATTASRDMEGEALEFGYNVAMAYKFDRNSNFSLTYRSNVDIKEEGNAKLYLAGRKVYDGGANVTIPLPAVLSAAVSYEFATKTTIEIEYDRTFWSEYKALDFDYESPIPNVLVSAFDDAKARNWDDTDAIRIGVTQQIGHFEAMAGFAYDTNPIPDGKVAFELPDSDALLFSLGGTYKIDAAQSVALGYLFDTKKSRNDTNPESGVDGEFSNAAAHLVSFGYRVSF